MTEHLDTLMEPSHDGWDGHVDDVARAVADIMANKDNPLDALAAADIQAGQMCECHGAVMLTLIANMLTGLEMAPSDVADIVAGIKGRPLDTIPYDTTA